MSALRTAVIAGALLVPLGWPHVLLGGSAGPALPPAAAKVIQAHFPGAKVTAVERERERGAWYYDVELNQSGRHTSIEVTEDGVIGEIEARVNLSDVPPAILDTLRQRVGNGKITRVERHERRGIVRSGYFVPLKTARILYDVRYSTRAGLRRETQVASNEIAELPKDVLARLAASMPGARILEVEVQDDDGVLLFVLALVRNGETLELISDRQGRLVESEIPVPQAEAPAPLLTALAGNRDVSATDATRISRRETCAAVENSALVPRHEITYAVRITRSDRQRELRFDDRGRLTAATDWESSRDAGDGEDDDGDN